MPTTPFDVMSTLHGNTATIGISFVTNDAASTHVEITIIHGNTAAVGSCIVVCNTSAKHPKAANGVYPITLNYTSSNTAAIACTVVCNAAAIHVEGTTCQIHTAAVGISVVASDVSTIQAKVTEGF